VERATGIEPALRWSVVTSKPVRLRSGYHRRSSPRQT
jgi:hypothetical protein